MRDDQRLHEWREPAAPRAAATVLLVRDVAGQLEVLMTRRSPNASFAPGAYVFPGGALDAGDAHADVRARCMARADQDSEQTGYCVAAIREAFEEVGVLLAADAAGPIDAPRAAQLQRDQPFLPALFERGWRPAVEQMYWLSHWITDRDLPKRFDARFFVCRMPDGQAPSADQSETFEPVWITPRAALEQFERGRFSMIFPTIRTMRAMQRFATVDALIDHCRAQGAPRASNPRGALLRGQVERFTEDEPPYAELELLAPDGRIVHTLDWQHEQPVPLTRSIWRWTAPNPSMMTGPGTNCYMVSDADQWIVIDPGPADAQHVERIARYTGNRIKLILCTHSHPDHSPGAWLLKQLCGAPVAGMASGAAMPPAWRFEPDQVLVDGDRIALSTMHLRVLHTPGHMSNHLCFLAEEDRLLFCGDHILNGSTTVINPPDGDMAAYLNALSRLRREPINYLLPAHGHVLGPAGEAIDKLIAHRLRREQKVLRALRDRPGGDVEQLVGTVYDDTPPALHGLAQRSLLAHLIKLERDGAARRVGDQWTAVH